jgi:adenylosuccinate synthase
MTNVDIIIGANYGDEGKGLATDYFAEKAARKGKQVLVVCSNGGAQRGHTVDLGDGRRHVFHHFGSGTFRNAATYLPKQFIVNPMIYVEEYNELTSMGVNPEICISGDCLVTTPFDMILNQIIEDSRGDKRHGSCGVGIWETILRDGKRFGELSQMHDDQLRKYLESIRKDYFTKRLSKEKINFGSPKYKELHDILDNYEDLIEHYIYDFHKMVSTSYIEDAITLSSFEEVIFENAQGLLLDQKFGDHSTPSNTGLQNPMEILSDIYRGVEDLIDKVNIHYISRYYVTRHGADPNFIADALLSYEDNTNIPNKYQGKLRFGKLDRMALVARINDDIFINLKPELEEKASIDLFFTHCDQLDYKMNKSIVGIPVRYKSSGPTSKDVYMPE